MDLKGNTIVITGGTSGIGLGMAERFLALGNKVIICGRRSDRLVKLSREHPGLVTRECDVADERHRLELFRWLAAHEAPTPYHHTRIPNPLRLRTRAEATRQ
jgi:uncharacterized oxidoreductase